MPSSFASLISLTTWSPRTSASTKASLSSPSLPITATDFAVRSSAMPISAATSSQVFCTGVATFAHRLAGGGARRGNGFGQFHVRGVIRTVRIQDGVLARIGDHLEFVRGAAADRAGIGRHRAVLQPQPGEDAAVGVVHVPVFGGERVVVDVERVGVLHQEFARAHHPEARADLVAELGVDLVEVDRQLRCSWPVPGARNR